MEMQIQSRNHRLSPTVRDYLTKKLERIEGRVNLPVDAHVVVSEEKTRSQQDRIVVEVTLRCNGTLLRGQRRAATVQAAVDALADTLDRRVAHFKSRAYRSEAAKRHGDVHSIRELESPEADAPVDDLDEEEETFGRVVRSKRFAMKADVGRGGGGATGAAGPRLLPVHERCYRRPQRSLPSQRRRLRAD